MITLICGAMFSGKTSRLMQYLDRHLIAGQKCILVRPLKDTRPFLSRSYKLSEKTASLYDTLYMEKLAEDFAEYLIDEGYKAVFVDEYFLMEGNRGFLEKFLMSDKDISVYLSGLLADSDGILFRQASDILPLCDRIEKLEGVCTECGSFTGSFSYHEGKKDKQIEVGDSAYKCVCGKCYARLTGFPSHRGGV